MNTLQVVGDAMQVVINVTVIWYIWQLHRRIKQLSVGHIAMSGSLDERTLNQAEYDAMSDEQKDANQADFSAEQEKDPR